MIIMLAFLAGPVTGAMSAPMVSRDLTGTNMEGIDHGKIIVDSAEECASLCDTTPGCTGATYVLPNTIQGPDGHCWRKSVVTGDTGNPHCISFTKLTILPITGCVMSNPHAEFVGQGVGKQFTYQFGEFAPLTMQFTDLSTGATSWYWDFGDENAIFDQKNPVHTYTVGSPEGTWYNVTLSVMGACPGETDTYTRPKMILVYDRVGFLSLSPTPKGATAYIDGTLIGTVSGNASTPKPLTPGNHTVRLTLDGYRDYSETVMVPNGKYTSFSPVLEKITDSPTTPVPDPGLPPVTTLTETATASQTPPGTGSLSVLSTPAGATVWLDGKESGTTPVRVPGVEPGTHRLVLTLQGYNDIMQPVEITGGTESEVNASFLQKKAPGFAVPVSLAALAFVVLVLTGRRKDR